MDTNNNDIENPFKAWKDLTDDDLVRGQMPTDIVEKSLQLCQKYVGGVWLKATTIEDIVVTRVTGGLTNQLYKIQLGEHIAAEHAETEDEPHALALKWYEPKHPMFHDNRKHDAFERLPDAIILSLASDRGLSPKVYGIFPEGFLQRFHEHEQFRIKHQQRPELVKEVATKLAQTHALRVPLIKERTPNLTSIHSNLKFAYDNFDIEGLCRELKLEALTEHDIREEAKYVEKIIKEIDSSRVFCHNDFRGSNILVTQPGDKILLCDMEYSRYGPRASDMAILLVEWGRELFDFEPRDMTPDEVIKQFAQWYIDEMNRLKPGYSDDAKNSVDTITKEVKAYFLVNTFFILTFLLAKDAAIIAKMENTKEEDLRICEPFYQAYFKTKATLIKDGIISA